MFIDSAIESSDKVPVRAYYKFISKILANDIYYFRFKVNFQLILKHYKQDLPNY